MKFGACFLFVLLLCAVLGFSSCASSPSVQASAPQSPPDYVTLARQDAFEAGIDPQLFVNQIEAESHFNPNARGADGEIGIAQFMPATAKGLGVNPSDPVASLKAASQMMGRYFKRYGDYAKALGAYNAGSGTVQLAIVRGGKNWKTFLPLSTQHYITVIMGEA